MKKPNYILNNKLTLIFIVLFAVNNLIAQNWSQIGQDIDGEAAFDQSGWSVSLSSDGHIVAIGAVENNPSGHVRIYQSQSGVWTQIGEDIDGETASDSFGASVSLSSDGSVVAIGVYENDGNGTLAGHVRIYKNPTLGISDNNLSTKYTLVKNPVGEQIQLKLNNFFSYNNVEVSVYNTSGQLVISEKLQNPTQEISINQNLNSGIYFLNVVDSETSFNVKIVVQ